MEAGDGNGDGDVGILAWDFSAGDDVNLLHPSSSWVLSSDLCQSGWERMLAAARPRASEASASTPRRRYCCC